MKQIRITPTKALASICILAVIAVGVAYWQLKRMQIRIDDSSVSSMRDISLASMSELVLYPPPKDTNALLTQYKRNPAEVALRAQEVLTWQRATTIADYAAGTVATSPIASSKLSGIPAEMRTDAWGNAYCIFKVRESIIVLSRGQLRGTGEICDQRKLAESIAASGVRKKLILHQSGYMALVKDGPRDQS